ncbi:bifunctional 3-(3-hydroxy-phenyl)propionate/3-hydroxycinnamic acid hydroxylase [Amycolatopsis sp. RM579]|uniref:Bifunctional 3-(3-hydroxy-phenyl)propionate/3-hydroxycinnamic acid hydroxylase n=2 Tax=Amycolatopsis pithecellobii TaxID=664692 RepID=A0A6N7ZB17_9PSEU|nr:bifunctional 3-(3-hydroxy-phenyl)propionate/3-hydroxycinnamic acid hydroxylase [Amycolatopsis pithecellobii]
MTLAALLGQLGHRVLVFERYAGLYNLPRAAAFDDETMRTFQKLGVAERMLPGTNIQPGYVWVNGQGDVLLDIEYDNPGRCGWPSNYMMYQPHLESVLDARVQEFPAVEVRRSTTVTDIRQLDDIVELDATGADGATHRVRARFVVGCDGGNGITRTFVGGTLDDYGFFENWLVCDFKLRRDLPSLPSFSQVCNPDEPIAIVNIGPGHHRFSFRLEPDVRREDATEAERVWRRVADYLTPEDADLIRIANYTFRSAIADTWRRGNVLLAGDAAHQMPPFLAQGMVSGIRDARNLAWKLDLVLSGHSAELLDSYQPEREPHVRFITEKAVELGRVQTMRDKDEARLRDERMIAARKANQKPDKLRYPGLTGGLIANHGDIFPQGLVSDSARTALFDDLLGTGWLLVTNGRQAVSDIAEQDLLAFAGLGGRHVSFGFDSLFDSADLYDTGGVYARWFTEHDSAGVIVRPDSYVYGLAPDAQELSTLLKQLLTVFPRTHPSV